MNTATKDLLSEIIGSGLTQTDVSERTGISQPTISRILRGLHVDMKASTAAAIASLHKQLFEAAA